MNYKTKLQPGDAVFIKGMSTEQIDGIIKRFIVGDCPASELRIGNEWILWPRDNISMLAHASVDVYVKECCRKFSLQDLFAIEAEPLPTRTLDQYIVWGPSGKTNPKFVHGNFDAALTEAERMSREHCAIFHVCGIIATVRAKPVTSIETEVTLNDEEQIPF